jgi:hypothetical protein
MFSKTQHLIITINCNWNTSKVTNMSSMFQGSSFNQDIGTKGVVTVNGITYTAWNTLNVTNISYASKYYV